MNRIGSSRSGFRDPSCRLRQRHTVHIQRQAPRGAEVVCGGLGEHRMYLIAPDINDNQVHQRWFLSGAGGGHTSLRWQRSPLCAVCQTDLDADPPTPQPVSSEPPSRGCTPASPHPFHARAYTSNPLARCMLQYCGILWRNASQSHSCAIFPGGGGCFLLAADQLIELLLC